MANNKTLQKKSLEEAIKDPRQERLNAEGYLQGGRVENDAFVINDIGLQIPPESIHVTKQAYNYEWSTLRTLVPRKAKSGHSIARVSIDVVFSDSKQINERMVPLIAGLRATPFCFVYNDYLKNKLLTLEESGGQDQKTFTKYKAFRPVSLALSSMTWTTCGHEGLPTCIRGHLEFIWFNYFPFTPIIAFKTGKSFDRAGFAWESELWKKFYAPFMSGAVTWPHKDTNLESTLLQYRQFTFVPQGSELANKAVADLLKVLQEKPEEVKLQMIRSFAGDDDTGGVDRAADKSNYLDVLYKRLAAKGLTNKAIADELQNQNLTRIGTGLIMPLLSDIWTRKHQPGKKFFRTKDSLKERIKDAAALFAQRAKAAKTATEQGQKAIDELSDQSFQKWRKKIDIKMPSAGQTVSLGGLIPMFKTRRLEIGPNLGVIVDRVVVTFSNILASIPMVGYRYPTIQHVGSVDMNMTLFMNASNFAAGELNTEYDRIESNALRFKQIPQGFLNVFIKNDFLSLFGQNEFITKSISSTTIPDQPGRSQVVMEFTQAGVTSKDKLADSVSKTDPEKLKQEFISASLSDFQFIWQTLLGVMKPEGFGKTAAHKNAQSNGSRSVNRFKLTITGVAKKTDPVLFNLAEKARNIYNEFLLKTHSNLRGGSFLENNTDKRLRIAALQTVKENDAIYKFVPYMDDFNKTLNAPELRSLNGFRAKSDTQYRKSISRAQLIGEISKTDPGVKIRKNQKLFAQRKKRMDDVGFSSYLLKMRALFQEVINNHLDHPKFIKLAERREKEGLGKGIMAYPDFHAQMTSLVGYAEHGEKANKQGQAVTNGQLLNYDPDAYFWYPVYDGGAASTFRLNNVVDINMIRAAQTLSQNVYKQAQQQVGTFFKDTYVELLKGSENDAPYLALNKALGDLKDGAKSFGMATPFYDGDTWKNTLRDADIKSSVTTIKKRVWPDSAQKVQTHGPKKDQALSTDFECTVSTDFEQMWGGVSAGSSPSATGSPTAAAGSPVAVVPRNSTKLAGKNKWKHLDKMRLEVQPLFEQLLDELQNLGYRPRIANSYRSAAAQIEKFKRGFSKTPKTGWHNWGLAADIIDRRWAWRPTRENAEFFAKMLQVARKLNLTTGATWFGRKGSRAKPTHKSVWNQWGIGWDPAHVMVNPHKIHVPRSWKRDLAKSRSGQTSREKERNLAKRATPPAPVRKTPPVSNSVTSVVTSPMTQAITQFSKDMLTGQGQSLMRAYPTFKLYFIEDDSGERKRLAFDDFFSYNAVKSIRVIRSRKIAADLCELYLTNVSGTLSNRKFSQARDGGIHPRTKSGKRASESSNPIVAGTQHENPIASLLLQEGIHISLRLGYSADPDLLPTVFNGTITAIQFSENEDLVRVVAQSHALELVSDMKGVSKPKTSKSTSIFGWDAWGWLNKAATGPILEELLSEPEVVHFGRWTAGSVNPNAGGGLTPNRELLTNRFTWKPRPQDDNIFAPPPSKDLERFGSGIVINDLKYTIYRTTIWDIFQEMTLRHPNFIASPVPYRDQGSERMTMFFGLPHQLYFSRHPTSTEQSAQRRLKSIIKELEKKKVKLVKNISPSAKFGTNDIIAVEDSGVKARLRQLQTQRLEEAKQAGYIKPFRSYHLLTSAQHIISNSIRTNSRDVANTIVIKYGKEVVIDKDAKGSDLSGVTLKGEEENFTLKLDNALPPEEIRTQIGQFINVTSEELAKRYALGLLCRNLKEIYKGDITILGNPTIKPYDVCYIFDEYTDMTGPIEVEEVQHIFDQQHGFRTEIKPDMLVQAAEWSLLSACEAMGVVMEGALRKVFGKDSSMHNLGSGKAFAPWPYMLGAGFSAFGGFLANKVINYTQLAQPVVMSPLMHHGRIFTGGVPTRKIPTSLWTTVMGTWHPNSKGGYHNWLEDWKDDTINSIKGSLGFFSQGKIGGGTVPN